MDEMKRINLAAEKVISELGYAEIGVILGSGLGDYADSIAEAKKLPARSTPRKPPSKRSNLLPLSPIASTR